MSRKQGIIHLGRSKSPNQLKVEPLTNRLPGFSMKTSRSKEPLQQTYLNQSMHIAPHFNQLKLENANQAHTHSGFFPPSPRLLEQVVVKENVKCPPRSAVIQGSPMKRVIVSRPITIPSEISPSKNESSILITRTSEADAQFQRKIKVLEGRIQQLHQQKQSWVVKSHEENKRLCSDNAMLQNRLANIENVKNQEITNLRQEIAHLRNIQNSQRIARVETSSKPVISNQIQKSAKNTGDLSPLGNKSLKNVAYIDDDQEDKVSLSNHTYKNDAQKVGEGAFMETSLVLKRNPEMQAEIKRLIAQNSALKSELKEIKQALVESSEAIEGNNNQIIASYEQKVSHMSEQITSYKNQNRQLTESLSFAQNQIEQYVQITIKKSQEMMKLQDKHKEETQSLKQQLSFCKEQIEDYVKKNLQMSQQTMRLQDMYKEKVRMLEQKCEELSHRGNQSLARIQDLSVKLSNTKAIVKCSQTCAQTDEERSVPESCQKCKELIKTLVKLNQKAFSKTS